MTTQENSRPPTPAEKPRRKRYVRPHLIRLGTLAEITLSVSDQNQMSDSGGPHLKT